MNILEKLFTGQYVEKWFNVHNKILDKDFDDEMSNMCDIEDNAELVLEDYFIENEEQNVYLSSKKLFSSLKMIVVVLNKLSLSEFKLEKIRLEKILQFLIEAKFKIIDYLLKYNSCNRKNSMKYNDFVKHLFSIVSTSLILIKSDHL